MAPPLVSVIIPTYNCAPYLGETIRSVFRQAYRHLEVIVVDGDSRDHTRAALAPYRDRIVWLQQEPRGIAAARNLGIQHAHGELIAFQDADDVWLPEKLKVQVRAFERHPDVALVFTDTMKFDDGGIVQESASGDMLRDWCREHGSPGSHVGYGSIYKELLVGNCIHTSSAVVRRSALDDVGVFDETFTTCEDYDLWLRIAQQYPVVYINRVFCHYRLRADGLSGAADTRQIRWGHDGIRVREKHQRNHWIPPAHQGFVREILSQRCCDLGYGYFSRNRFKDARSLFLRGLRHRRLPGHLSGMDESSTPWVTSSTTNNPVS